MGYPFWAGGGMLLRATRKVFLCNILLPVEFVKKNFAFIQR